VSHRIACRIADRIYLDAIEAAPFAAAPPGHPRRSATRDTEASLYRRRLPDAIVGDGASAGRTQSTCPRTSSPPPGSCRAPAPPLDLIGPPARRSAASPAATMSVRARFRGSLPHQGTGVRLLRPRHRCDHDYSRLPDRKVGSCRLTENFKYFWLGLGHPTAAVRSRQNLIAAARHPASDCGAASWSREPSPRSGGTGVSPRTSRTSPKSWPRSSPSPVSKLALRRLAERRL
jgi:hypothetical protein